MVWRAGAKTNKGADRKFAIRRYVSDETPIGLLGYSEGEPVAWCSIAPRPTYRDLGGPNRAGELPEQVWSLACFFIRRDLRGQGLTKQIIEAAVQHAEKRGATVIERIPSIQAPRAIALWDTYRRSYRRDFTRLAELEHVGMSCAASYARREGPALHPARRNGSF